MKTNTLYTETNPQENDTPIEVIRDLFDEEGGFGEADCAEL